MMLRATDGQAPQPTDPFLIVDAQQTVQAISAHAEHILGVNEPDSVNAQLEDFLEPAIGQLDEETLGRALTLAVDGCSQPGALELRAAENPRRRFRARVTSCGDPPAALLVLAVA